jgi:MYXO-CTERM domain-containing protein
MISTGALRSWYELVSFWKMKRGDMRHIFSTLAVVLVLGFGISSIMAAQQPRDVPAQSVNTVDDGRRDGRDWGWLGLVGLVGLVGLRRRDSDDRSIVRTDSHSSSVRP